MTERIMARIRQREPELLKDTLTYNRVWSSVLDALEADTEINTGDEALHRLLFHNPSIFDKTPDPLWSHPSA